MLKLIKNFNKDVHSSCWKSIYCAFVTSHRARKKSLSLLETRTKKWHSSAPRRLQRQKTEAARSDARSPLLAVLIPTVGLLRQSRRFHFPWHSETQRAAWRQDSPPPPPQLLLWCHRGLYVTSERGGGQLAKDVWRSFFVVACWLFTVAFNTFSIPSWKSPLLWTHLSRGREHLYCSVSSYVDI
jgi:hypothetical protein